MLEEKGLELDAVIELKVDEAILLQRIEKRVAEMAARGEPLRADDNAEALKKRLDAYRRQTAPLIGYYAGRGMLQDHRRHGSDRGGLRRAGGRARSSPTSLPPSRRPGGPGRCRRRGARRRSSARAVASPRGGRRRDAGARPRPRPASWRRRPKPRAGKRPPAAAKGAAKAGSQRRRPRRRQGRQPRPERSSPVQPSPVQPSPVRPNRVQPNRVQPRRRNPASQSGSGRRLEKAAAGPRINVARKGECS